LIMQAPLNIFFAVGGTGGHLFPAIAIAQEFMARNCASRIIFLGTGKPIEVSVLSEYGFDSRKISAEGIKGRGLFRQAKALLVLMRGVFQSIGILRSEKPDLVVGMGSYSSVPVVLAAWLNRIPVVVCEQNVLPGIANRYLSRIADRVCVSFKDTLGNLPKSKLRFTGNPVRIEILKAVRKKKDMEGPFTVLILGGSQGAHGINMAVIEALGTLKENENVFFIHQTGESDENNVRKAYEKNRIPFEVKAFFKDMARIYARADLVVCRAGATTVAEVSALGKPAIFIPFPHAADDHQVLNAQNLCAAGASEMIHEKVLTGELLAEKILNLAKNHRDLQKMAEISASLGHPDAAMNIVDECCEVIRNYNGIFPRIKSKLSKLMFLKRLIKREK
jgi:UDP-N-acetylglucosamine--N-acetylmuramyl-(pentapeptide) pyrophosphoryl-undecaprenol N-acetylglucosamine transferase